MKRAVMFSALSAASCGDVIAATKRKSDQRDPWARGVEKKFPVADAEGMGQMWDPTSGRTL